MEYENNRMLSKPTPKNELDNYVKAWKIFMDTCSILHFAADKFWKNIIPLLKKYQNKVIIPMRCIEELSKHKANKKELKLAENAKNCLKVLDPLIKNGLVEIRGEKGDKFADHVFHMVFDKFRTEHKLLLITQDNDLAKDILAKNGITSVRGYSVDAKRINQSGFLSNFTWNTDSNKNDNPKQNRRKNNEEYLDEDKVFEICTSVTTLDDSIPVVKNIPAENKIVYTLPDQIKKEIVHNLPSKIILKSKVSEGGEGIVYTTNIPFYVAKIYKKEKNTKRKHEKIKLMLSKEIECEGVCYPVAALYNSNQEFVGYMMPKAEGTELQKSIFIPLLVFMKRFPNWKKRDTVELCITILEKIKYLHDRNIVIGDINPANILVVSPKKVYFVDTDSYQVEDFPCPVGTINYTAPEIQRKKFPDFLRTMGNENFAVATLLFMIMLPGKPPYSQQGGEDLVDNIIKMGFSYPFGDSSNKKTPEGRWRYIWSHLTYELKKAFYNTFIEKGDFSTENKRLTANMWLPMFKRYLELLDSGKFGEQDKMSEELFPTRHKKNPNVEYVTCKFCHNEVPKDKFQNGICGDCLNKGEVYICKKCGKKILYTNYQKYIKKVKPFDICRECFEGGNKVIISKNCVDCGNQFEITNSQYDFYTSKGFDIPKRCESCRDAKKNHSYRKNESFCFISTVICGYFGKDDNCTELSTLRGYRDNWLINQPDGQQLITEYYNNAPFIVSKFKASAKYAYYCQYLWNNYLQPCLAFIEKKEFESCKKLYIEMYQYLRCIILKGED